MKMYICFFIKGDPVMFATYTASRTKQALHTPLGPIQQQHNVATLITPASVIHQLLVQRNLSHSLYSQLRTSHP